MNCLKCGENKRNKYGRCRICHREWERLYNLTPKRKSAKMWSGIIARAENKNGKQPAYQNVKLLMTREEFYAWVIPELEKWILTKSIESASIDRVDNDGHYEISNLQLLTRLENRLKQKRNKNLSAPEGYAWCSHCKEYLITDKFTKGRNKITGLQNICKFHQNQYYQLKQYEQQNKQHK